jgi:hypothetical protein
VRGGTRLRPGRARSFADSASAIWSLEMITGAQIAAALAGAASRVQKAASFKVHESMLEIGMNWHLDQQLNDMERD